VRETNLAAQIFFRAQGFQCIDTLRKHEQTGEDAYLFEYVWDQGREVLSHLLFGDGRTVQSYKEART